jgi:hypothetical protein
VIADTPSSLVIISWWSNCLALALLRSLDALTFERDVLVVQVGKSAEQAERFRALVPQSVKILPYPVDAPAEHSRVIADVVFRQRRLDAGLWFVDHDVAMREPLGPWLRDADAQLRRSPACLCVAPAPTGPAITQPAFWMSPQRWPPDCASIDPVPYIETATSRRPDLFPASGELRMPECDTLVGANHELLRSGLATVFPSPFPDHSHLGGLSLFSSRTVPPVDAWVRTTVARFSAFFESCPPHWLAAEDPTLLARCAEFRGVYGD